MISPVIFLNNTLSFASYFKYPLIAVGTVVEGPILMIASGFLYRNGVFELLPLFIAILIGDLIGDVIWYVVGRYFALPVLNKKGSIVGITPEKFEKIKELFSKYHERILIFSKITLGLGFALGVLVTAGIMKVSFKRYMFINIVGEFFLVSFMISIGYFFGEIYLRIPDSFKVEFLISVFMIISISLYVFSKYIKNKSKEL